MKTLGSILTYRKGKPPKTSPEGVLPVLTPEYLRTGILEDMAEITGREVVLAGGELVLLWDGSNAGEFFRSRPGVLSSTMVVLDFDQRETKRDYLYYELKRFQPVLKGKTAGSGIPHVDKEIFLAHSLSERSPEEQDAVSTVLATLDRAIEQTEAVLAKQKRVINGLIHDLLTVGIDNDGRLRDPSTHRFQPSPFGSIPEEWFIGTLLDATSPARQPVLTGPFGADLGLDDFVEDGVPLLRIGNVQDGRLDLSELLFVTHDKAKELERYRVQEGDLLFARQGATTGRNALATREVSGFLINYHIIRVALDHSRCAPIFIEATFNSDIVRRQIDRDKGRGTREGISTTQLKAVEFPIAPITEQRQIESILRTAKLQMAGTDAHLQMLRRLKQGLMRDLLTDIVSIEPLLAACVR